MKIALVSPYDYPYPGGVTNHISHLDEEFTRLGHAVTILAPSSSGEAELAERRVVKLGSVVPVPANGSEARITLSLRLSGRVKRLLDAERFDVIHLHEPLMPALPITVLRHSQTVNVGTFHSSWDSRVARLYGNPLLRRFDRRLHARIAVSPRARDFVAQHFPGDYRVIPNGIAPDEFGPDVEPLPQLRDGKLNVLFVGRLEQRKGFGYLLRAFARLQPEHPELRLVVVGAYGERPRRRYQALAAKAGVHDVLFVGPASTADLPRYYRSCDVFCAPSTGGESQGIVLLEAMAAGKPVVASDIAGYRGALRDGVEGLFVRPKDAEALAQALRLLAEDPELRDRLGAAGRVRARDFAWGVVAEQVLQVYEETRAQFRPRWPVRRSRRRVLGRYLRRLSGLLVPLGSAGGRYAF
jgi:phosphatidylinositol alpha-mannosyltransferase